MQGIAITTEGGDQIFWWAHQKTRIVEDDIKRKEGRLMCDSPGQKRTNMSYRWTCLINKPLIYRKYLVIY